MRSTPALPIYRGVEEMGGEGEGAIDGLTRGVGRNSGSEVLESGESGTV